MKNLEKNNGHKMMQKVFAIVNKETKEIESFGTAAAPVKAEWDEYYVGIEEEGLFELQQTFMSQDDIRNEMGI